ncbi:unnamed protein product, partial [Amoebophrya sp. A25]|eukprot:GSA25T00003278001.1
MNKITDPEFNYGISFPNDYATPTARKWLHLLRKRRVLLFQAIEDPFTAGSYSHQIVIDYYGRILFRHCSAFVSGHEMMAAFHDEHCMHSLRRYPRQLFGSSMGRRRFAQSDTDTYLRIPEVKRPIVETK